MFEYVCLFINLYEFVQVQWKFRIINAIFSFLILQLLALSNWALLSYFTLLTINLLKLFRARQCACHLTIGLSWSCRWRWCRCPRHAACRSSTGLRTCDHRACDTKVNCTYISSVCRERRVNLPMEGTVAFLLVIDVVALVLAAIWPLEHAWALHFVVPPHSFVLSTIRPVVDT